MKTRHFQLIIGAVTLMYTTACNKTVNINPPVNQLASNNVFLTDNSASAAMAGVYAKFINTSTYDYLPTLLPSLSSDELNSYIISSGGGFNDFVNDAITITNTFDDNIWYFSYNVIYQANAMIEGLQGNSSVSPSIQSQLIGESKFIRAFFYFQLTNFYSDVPLLLSTNVNQNMNAPRTAQAKVYQQIITDLNDAQNLLSDTYVGTGRARVNKSTATALLARVYLYQQDWKDAETQSSAVIANANYLLEPNLNNVFLSTSRETIFQYATINGYNDIGSNVIPLSTAGATVNYAYTNDFLNAIEAGDLRQSNWIGKLIVGTTTYYYPYKYKNRTTASSNLEYFVAFRLSEQYLIRAEARAEQNNISGAQSDLNMIRNRAGLGNTTASDQASLLTAIEKERRIELASEWGHRWFDLKRTNRADIVLSSLKSSWKPTAKLYPIPAIEISGNPNLTQNSGY